MKLKAPVSAIPLSAGKRGMMNMLHVLTDAGPRVVLARTDEVAGTTSIWVMAGTLSTHLSRVSEREIRQLVVAAYPCGGFALADDTDDQSEGITRPTN